jgi:hypothetical protein
MAGVGITYAEYNDAKPPGLGLKVYSKGIYPALGVGAGLEYFVVRNFSLNADARWLYTWDHEITRSRTPSKAPATFLPSSSTSASACTCSTSEAAVTRATGAFQFLNHPQHSRDFRRSGPRQYRGRTLGVGLAEVGAQKRKCAREPPGARFVRARGGRLA